MTFETESLMVQYTQQINRIKWNHGSANLSTIDQQGVWNLVNDPKKPHTFQPKSNKLNVIVGKSTNCQFADNRQWVYFAMYRFQHQNGFIC